MIDETVLVSHYKQSEISESLMTSAEFRELALMTSEDFDGRLHTYAIGIKLALGSNLQVCTSLVPSWWNYTGIKLAKLAIPVSEKHPDCRPKNIRFGGLDGSPASYIWN